MLTYTCERCGVTVKRARGNEGRGRFCSVKCGRAAQVMKSREQRFWEKVVRAGPDECWDWRGTTNAAGYGRMRTGPRGASVVESAHRISLELALGRPLTGDALHHCDRPSCVNPAHLYEGSQADNTRDRDVRERMAHRKLTAEDVRLMRGLRARGWSFQKIADGFGVNLATCHAAVTGKAWKHVT
jgi:hypothetical protein